MLVISIKEESLPKKDVQTEEITLMVKISIQINQKKKDVPVNRNYRALLKKS